MATITFKARAFTDPRGGYGYDILEDGKEIGHVYEASAGELYYVRWRATVKTPVGTAHASRSTRKRAVEAVLIEAKEIQS